MSIPRAPDIRLPLVTALHETIVIDAVRDYLERTGFQPAPDEDTPKQKGPPPALRYVRGTHWEAQMTQSPKLVRTQVELRPLDSDEDGLTRVELRYMVTIPPGWGVNRHEADFWDADVTNLICVIKGEPEQHKMLRWHVTTAIWYNCARLLGCYGLALLMGVLMFAPLTGSWNAVGIIGALLFGAGVLHLGMVLWTGR